jgi:hypothetical protein
LNTAPLVELESVPEEGHSRIAQRFNVGNPFGYCISPDEGTAE